MEAVSRLYGFLRTAECSLDSADFVFIFAFQSGVIQLPYLFVNFALPFVKLACYPIIACFHHVSLVNGVSPRNFRDKAPAGIHTLSPCGIVTSGGVTEAVLRCLRERPLLFSL